MATFTSELKRIHKLIASEKYDRAVGDLEAMIDRYPGNAFLHCLLGQAIQLTEDGSLVVAEMHLRRACEYSQNDIRCLYELYRFLDATRCNEDDAEMREKMSIADLVHECNKKLEALGKLKKVLREKNKAREWPKTKSGDEPVEHTGGE